MVKCIADSENMACKEEWKDCYAFILPGFINTKLGGLICNKAVTVCKEYNLRWHHIRKHNTFKVAFLLGNWSSDSELCTQQQDATARPHSSSASWKPPWVLAWHNRSFTEAEVLKQVLVTFCVKLAADKSLYDITASAKQFLKLLLFQRPVLSGTELWGVIKIYFSTRRCPLRFYLLFTFNMEKSKSGHDKI